MRKSLLDQLPLAPVTIDHHHARELSAVSVLLDQLPDAVVEQGNPADSTLAVTMVQRQRDVYGKVPRQVCFDGGFASRANLANIKAVGVEDVAFHKRCRLEIEDMVKSTWVYRQLKRFRAGAEGCISFLKRCFGLDRCNWRGFASFQAYCWSSVIAANLLTLARHRLA